MAVSPFKVDYSGSKEQLLLIVLAYILNVQSSMVLASGVFELLQDILSIEIRDRVFQAWMRPRLKYAAEGSSFSCHLDCDEYVRLPISVGRASINGTIEPMKTLTLGAVARQDILSWIDSVSRRDTDQEAVADLLLHYQSGLCEAIWTSSGLACFAL